MVLYLYILSTRPLMKETNNTLIVIMTLTISLIIFLTVLFALREIKGTVEKSVRSALETILQATDASFNQWQETQFEKIRFYANSEAVVREVKKLSKLDPTEIIKNPDVLQNLRNHFNSILGGTYYKGFFIIRPDFINIASMRNENLGVQNLLVADGILEQVFQGKTLLSNLVTSDVKLLDSRGVLSENQMSMFSLSPIKNEEGKIIAALSFRIAIGQELTRIANIARINETGETYFFNHNTILLNESRFRDQLVRIGLLAPDQPSVFNIQVKDPGYQLKKESISLISQNDLPPTFMAESAMAGERGSNLEGYRDYRGIPVIGVWKWYPKLRIGLTTEIDFEEAFELYFKTRNIIFIVVAVIVLLLFSFAFVLAKGRKMAMNLVKQKTEDLRRRSHALESEILIRKKTEEKLEKSRERAEANARIKSIFMANMSHEIRTPMNSILGFIQLSLEYSQLPERVRDHLNVANQSAKALLNLINDILDISKLESGNIGIENIIFHLPTLLQDTLKTMKIKAKEKSLEMNLEIAPEIAHCFLGDPNRLRQVLLNLVGNAIKFTLKGRVKITVNKDPNGKIHFSILDTGIGMTKEQIREVFQPFKQADDSTARRFGGTGLGTTISKQIVELMGGQIWIESVLREGTTFHFTVELELPECFPDCQSECGENFKVAPPALPSSKRIFQILLAEDVPANITLALIQLERQGHSVRVAANGKEAVELFKTNSFDLVLMDVQMPVMDGLTATREIRSLELHSNRHTPIIALTASVLQEEKELCLNTGMDEILAKPVDFDELFKTMESVVPEGVGVISASQDIDIDTEKEAALPNHLEGVDLKRGLQNWRDAEAYAKALLDFSKRYATTAEQLQFLLNEGNFDEAKMVSHALKGVAGNLSIIKVEAVAKEIDFALGEKNLETVKSLLPNLSETLVLAVESINTIQLPKQKKGSKSKSELNLKEVQEVNHKLHELFDRGETDDALLEKYKSLLEDHIEPTLITNLTNAVDHFDFELARVKLESIANELRIKTPPLQNNS